MIGPMVVEVREEAAGASGVAARIGDFRGIRRDVLAVFVVALAMRVGMVAFSRGGPWGSFGYDGSVYYSAADALSFGRLPYRDFVLLHPPAVMLALTPFAAFGRVFGDHVGYVVANTAFEVLGAVNAALVVVIARRLQLARPAAVLGGMFYAVWSGIVGAEYGIRLEPLGSFAFLCALLALSAGVIRAHRTGARRNDLLAGAALAVALSTKIWWIVPALVVVAWQGMTRPPRRVGMLCAGLVASAVAINGVFFVAAPGLMWHRVVLDQLDRPRSTITTMQRLEQLSSLYFALQGAGRGMAFVVLAFVAMLVAVACVAAWRVTQARVLVVVLIAQLIVLLVGPSYFTFYAAYAGAAEALVLAAATHQGLGGRGRRAFRSAAAVIVVAAGLITASKVIYAGYGVARFPGATRLATAVRPSRCLMADSPMALIELDALSRDLAHGCANWVDVTGRTYNVDRPTDGKRVSRARNARWQVDLRRYLLSGNAVILVRTRSGTGPSAATLRIIAGHHVIATAGGYTVYRTSDAVLPSPETAPVVLHGS
jgi:alpha-1,2-mannosyltransferase